MNKLVSVIIPGFNCSKYIEETIESVLNQTYSNIEVIYVDDHSTDNSLELVKNTFHDKVNTFVNNKKGASSARNYGLSQSKGEIVQFLDSDDVILPLKMESQVPFLNDATVVFSDYEVWNESFEKKIETICFQEFSSKNLMPFLSKTVSTQNPIYSVSLLKRLGGYDEELGSAQDWDFNLKMILSHEKIVYTPGVYSKTRRVSESLSSNWVKVSENQCKVIKKWKKEILNFKDTLSAEELNYLTSLYYNTLIFGEHKDWIEKEFLFWYNKSGVGFIRNKVKRRFAKIFGIKILINWQKRK